MPEITITVPGEVAERLTVLCDPTWECATIADVTEKLLDHAQQGVYRPGAWEREWLCQAFGYDWTARLVPDTRPEMLSGDGRVIFDRPAGDGGGDGPPVPSRGAVMTAEILSDPAALGEIRAAEAEIARGDAVRGSAAVGALRPRHGRSRNLTDDDRTPLIIDSSAPAEPGYVLELAEAFAEIPRALNHLTRHHEALEHPAEGDQLAGFLESAAYRERQLAPQIATWYVLEAAAGRLEVTGGEWKGLPDVAVAVLTARANLVKAAAEELAKAWKSMAQVTSTLAAAETGEGGDE